MNKLLTLSLTQKEGSKMRGIVVILAISICCFLALSCQDNKAELYKAKKIEEIKQLLGEDQFELARIAALDTLDPEIRALYFKADDKLGHASHLDVRCNERIEEILYKIVKNVPTKYTNTNRDIYAELISLYPENQLYKKKYIFYDRKSRK